MAKKITQGDMFVFAGDNELSPSQINSINQSLMEEAVAHTSTASSRTSRLEYSNISTNISARSDFTRADYEYFRPDEAIPITPHGIISACRSAYHNIGLVRNIIDIMSDFGTQGIRLTHPVPEIQQFYNDWFDRVDGKQVSERFLNLLYREGLAVAKRVTGRLSIKQRRAIEKRANELVEGRKIPVDNDGEGGFVEPKTKVGVIPLRYYFINPLILDVVNPDLASLTNKIVYRISISPNIARAIKNPNGEIEKGLVESIPKAMRDEILKGERGFILDPDQTSVYYYKKDSWQTWPKPMLYAILNELNQYQKMQLADMAALDSAICHVRLWKLGDWPNKIYPTKAQVSRLSNMLVTNNGKGVFDIVWPFPVELQEHKTDMFSILGEEKYKPLLNAIYAGLGVPPTLTGSATASGFTNNYISLKTLIQRLEYGRTLLKDFWRKEIEIVQKAMGFKDPATLHFDKLTLADEAAEKAILIDLFDRNLISRETMLEYSGDDAALETLRLNREDKLSEAGKLVAKAGPWNDGEKMHTYTKIALQNGDLTPEQAGIDFEGESFALQKFGEEKEGRKAAAEGNKGEPGEGRPLNSKDNKPRKQRTVKPVGSSSASASYDEVASFMAVHTWSKAAYEAVASIIVPTYLQHVGKNNLRQLSGDEFEELEAVKFGVIANLQPFQPVNEESVLAALKPAPQSFNNAYKMLRESCDGELSTEDVRSLKLGAYACLHMGS